MAEFLKHGALCLTSCHPIFKAMTALAIPFHKFGAQSKVVFFTGAGISAESGISTFRDPDGLWEKYDPALLASAGGFKADPELVLSWYAGRRESIRKAKPHAGHLSITNFQKLFRHSVVITQNVDGLHSLAGNKPVYELHGNIHKHKCFRCGAPIELNKKDEKKINTCDCGGLVRPDVVWFGESLDMETLQFAFDAVRESDLMITVGTSNQVYPAAQLPFEAQKNNAYVIEINPETTPFSEKANLVIREPAALALPKLYEEFHANIS